MLHGVQLEISNIPTNPEIKKILEATGTLERVDEQKNRYGTIYRVELEGSTQSIYARLKVLIKRHNLYRTYDIQKASQLYLEDLKLPPSVVRELLNEN